MTVAREAVLRHALPIASIPSSIVVHQYPQPAAVALLVLSAMLHATALLLAPALIVGMLLAPHLPRLHDYAFSTAIVLVLLTPTVLWEFVSNWPDLCILTSYTSGSAKVDPEVFFRLYQALGGSGLAQSSSALRPVPHSLGAVTSLLFVEPVSHPALGLGLLYAAATPLYIAVAFLALLLFVTGWSHYMCQAVGREHR